MVRETALANGEWKAATILAGSVIEALLLWVLSETKTEQERAAAITALNAKPPTPPSLQPFPPKLPIDCEKWKLYHMIAVAGQFQGFGHYLAYSYIKFNIVPYQNRRLVQILEK